MRSIGLKLFGIAEPVLSAVGLLAVAAVSTAAETGGGQATSLRRLTQDQHRQSIADLFGDDIKVSARLEMDQRRQGLLAIGASAASVGAAGFEQYDAAAREVAAQVVDERHRATLIGCIPAAADRADQACASAFFERTGRMLYRRPLRESEVARFTGIAAQAATARKDFYAGIALGLATMLESPPFLFRMERTDGAGSKLDDYALASRLSFLIWNAPPDDMLLRAAGEGRLRSGAGLREQATRLLASPRFEQGVRAFFSDMLALERLDSVQKDAAIYPRFSAKLAADAKEQTLRTIVDLLVRRDAPYAELFTTRRTFLSRSLGLLYSMPVTSRTGFEPVEFAGNDPRAGLLAQPAFLIAYSHPGRSSPTLRGKAIRELLLCEEVPPPPPNVDFALVQDVSNPRFATARLRLAAHNNDPTCAGCHKLTDPLGLALENFDGAGGPRERENGAAIDPSGTLNGRGFDGPAAFGQALAGDPGLSACLIERVFSYGAGAGPDPEASAWLASLDKRYAASGIHLRELFLDIALSDHFARLQRSAGADSAVASMTSPVTGVRR